MLFEEEKVDSVVGLVIMSFAGKKRRIVSKNSLPICNFTFPLFLFRVFQYFAEFATGFASLSGSIHWKKRKKWPEFSRKFLTQFQT